MIANNGRMPYGYMSTFLEENKRSFDWLTRDIVNSAYTRFKKRRLELHSDRKQPTISEIQLERLSESESKWRKSEEGSVEADH